MKFNHLNVPTHWQSYWTRFPEGHTILEALISWVSQVDSMVDNVNSWNDYLDNFVASFDNELQQTTTDILSDWQESGFLNFVINEALQWQLDDYITTNEQDKLSLETQLTATKTTAENAEITANTAAQKAEAMASGSPRGVYATLTLLQDAFPTGTTGAYIVSADGNWYYWNGSAWTIGGVYQASSDLKFEMFTDPYRAQLENITSTVDLDTVKKDGLYVCVSPINAPPALPGTFYLEVSSFMGGYQDVTRWTIQKAYSFTDPTTVYTRKTDIMTPENNTAWAMLKTPASSIGRTTLANSFLSSPVILTNTTDLNDVKNDGVYLVTNALNKPTTLTGSAFLEVKTQLSDTNQLRWVTQTIRDYFNPAIRYTRQLDTVTPANSLPWRADYISPLVGKKVVFFGDSIPAGAGATNPGSDSYPAQLISQYGLQVVNKSIGGASWQYDGVYDNISLIYQVENTDFSDVDIAVFHAGTNDFGRGALPIGTNEDTVKITLKGAYNYIMTYIYTQNPNIKIMVISPTWRQRMSEGDNLDSDFNAINGKYLIDYVSALEEVSDYNHIKFVNLYHSLGVNKYNYDNWLSDGLHFNTKGHKELLAPRVHSELISL